MSRCHACHAQNKSPPRRNDIKYFVFFGVALRDSVTAHTEPSL